MRSAIPDYFSLFNCISSSVCLKRRNTLISALFFISMHLLFGVNDAFAAPPGLLARYDVAGRPSRMLTLPSSLHEISGIAVSSDGKLFAHDDEVSMVFQLDPADGKVVKRFDVVTNQWFGKGRIEDDFEDIAIAGSRFFLVTSKGTIYEFREGKNGEKVQAATYRTGLGKHHEVEGLCYDPPSRSLLLTCKSIAPKAGRRKGSRPVYSFSIASSSLLEKPRFVIDAVHVAGQAGMKDFQPSAITRNPHSGSFFVLSSKSRLIAEIEPHGGALLGVRKLSPAYHPQPEGIAFLGGDSLLIGNEGLLHGTISVYGMRQ